VWRLEQKSIGLADMDFLPNKVVAPFCLQSIPFLSLSLSPSLPPSLTPFLSLSLSLLSFIQKTYPLDPRLFVTSRKKERKKVAAKETKEVKEDQSWKKKANPNSHHKRLY